MTPSCSRVAKSVLVIVCLLSAPFALAQSAVATTDSLPDAPETRLFSTSQDTSAEQAAGTPAQIAPKKSRVIEADETAQPLTAGDKFAIANRRVFSLGMIASPAISAGYSHLLNSAPHYGTDSAGFGERYGAATYRRVVNAYTTSGVYAVLFHDDPRYYVLGPRYGVKRRLIYAASRAIITRTDKGGQTINLPSILGPATAQASAIGFYPNRDRTASRVIGGTFTSIAITAGLFEWSEFGRQIKQHFRHH